MATMDARRPVAMSPRGEIGKSNHQAKNRKSSENRGESNNQEPYLNNLFHGVRSIRGPRRCRRWRLQASRGSGQKRALNFLYPDGRGRTDALSQCAGLTGHGFRGFPQTAAHGNARRHDVDRCRWQHRGQALHQRRGNRGQALHQRRGIRAALGLGTRTEPHSGVPRLRPRTALSRPRCQSNAAELTTLRR